MLGNLVLTATAGAWRLFITRKADRGFSKFAEKVLERDQHTCQFCGFQARQFQEIVNRDHNYRNNKLSNMTTACCFCMQCFFFRSSGTKRIWRRYANLFT